MKISKAKARLDKLLIREGFDFNHPDLIKGYQAFKAFAKETVECKEELFLFECGMFINIDKLLYHLGFIRQFIIEDAGSYKQKIQLRIDFTCDPNASLTPLSIVLWAEESASMELFFKKIENSTEYRTAIIQSAWDCMVHQETIPPRINVRTSLLPVRRYLSGLQAVVVHRSA
jgi:ribosomal protein S8